jgi:conjugative transfer pilus assembly protein TraH
MKTSLKKKTSAMMMGVMLASISAPAAAGFVEDFFDDAWVQTTSPRIYETQRRGGLIGGSVSVRVPNRSISVVNFTPPSFEAGCGGVDLNFGAFGFIDGQELIELLKRIGQQAKALLFQIAVETLNQMLGGLMKEFAAKVQAMNALLRNSCDIAQGAANAFAGVLGNNERQTIASNWWENKVNVAKGVATEWDGVKREYENSKAVFKKATTPEEEQAKKDNPTIGNLTWRALKIGNSVNYLQFGAGKAGDTERNKGLAMLLLSNVVGTSVSPVITDEEATACKSSRKDPGTADGTPTNGSASTSANTGCTPSGEVFTPKITSVSVLAEPTNILLDACISGDAPSGPDKPQWLAYVESMKDTDCETVGQGVVQMEVVFAGTKAVVNQLLFGVKKATLTAAEYESSTDGIVAYLQGKKKDLSVEEVRILGNMEMPVLAIMKKVQRDPNAVMSIAKLMAGPMAEREALRMARSIEIAATNIFATARDKVKRPDEYDANVKNWRETVRLHEVSYGDDKMPDYLSKITTYAGAVYMSLPGSAVGASR